MNWSGLLVILVLSQGVRLLAMAIVPYMDTSEPRYAEIARIMAQTGDWITPWFEPGVPFWGKPPLSFWTQALGIHMFGDGEFVARLPGWLAMVLVAWLLYRYAATEAGPTAARWGVAIYSTMALPFVSSGAVLTDPFLTLGVTWSLVSIGMLAREPTRRWQYGFFGGIAVGLLAKGPIALVLVAGVMLAWAASHSSARRVIGSLPWFPGLMITCVVVAPWYALAEIKTPGFLSYFLLGEHWLRFVDAGWAGDLYGTAHRRPYGAIWIDTLAATMPWGLIALGMMAVAASRAGLRTSACSALRESPVRFLLIWAMAVPVFFTFSGNILWTYALPSLAPVAILLGWAMQRWPLRYPARLAIALTAVLPVLFAALVAMSALQPERLKTEKALIQMGKDLSPNTPVRFVGKPPFSARYYSAGTAEGIDLRDVPELAAGSRQTLLVAVDRREEPAFRQALRQHAVELLGESARYRLFKVGRSL